MGTTDFLLQKIFQHSIVVVWHTKAKYLLLFFSTLLFIILSWKQ